MLPADTIPHVETFETLPPQEIEFQLKISRIKVGDCTWSDAVASVVYSESFDLILKLRLSPLDLLVAEHSQAMFSEEAILEFSFDSPPHKLPIGYRYNLQDKYFDLRITLPKTWCIGNLNNAVSLSCVYVNGPNFLFQGFATEFSGNDCVFQILDFYETYELRKFSMDRIYLRICSGVVGVTLEKGAGNPQKLLKKLEQLRSTFSFLKGGTVSFGHLIGRNTRGDIVYFSPSFERISNFDCPPNFYSGAKSHDECPITKELTSRLTGSIGHKNIVIDSIDFLIASADIRRSDQKMSIVLP